MLWSEQWRALGPQQPIQAQAEPILSARCKSFLRLRSGLSISWSGKRNFAG